MGSFQDSIMAAKALIREAIQSPNFDAGNPPRWQIARDGTSTFAGTTIESEDPNGYSIVIENGVVKWLNSSGVEVARIGMNPDDNRLLLTGDTGIGVERPMTREALSVTGANPVGASHVAATSFNYTTLGDRVKVVEPVLHFYPMLDLTAAGRAGRVYWEASFNGGSTWITVESRRWHDSGGGEDINPTLVCSDTLLHSAINEFQYRCRVTTDGGSGNVALRGDSTAFIEWYGL